MHFWRQKLHFHEFLWPWDTCTNKIIMPLSFFNWPNSTHPDIVVKVQTGVPWRLLPTAESPLQSLSSYYQLLRVDCSTAAFVSWRRSRAVLGSVVIVININPRAQLSYEHQIPNLMLAKHSRVLFSEQWTGRHMTYNIPGKWQNIGQRWFHLRPRPEGLLLVFGNIKTKFQYTINNPLACVFSVSSK